MICKGAAPGHFIGGIAAQPGTRLDHRAIHLVAAVQTGVAAVERQRQILPALNIARIGKAEIRIRLPRGPARRIGPLTKGQRRQTLIAMLVPLVIERHDIAFDPRALQQIQACHIGIGGHVDGGLTPRHPAGDIRLGDQRPVEFIRQGRLRGALPGMDIGTPGFHLVGQGIVAKVESQAHPALAQRLDIAALHQRVVAAVGEHHALSGIAIGIHPHAGIDRQRIAFAIHPDAGAALAGRQQIGGLADPVVAAVDMQPQAQQRGVVPARHIGRALGIAGEIALRVDDVQTAAVDRAPKEIVPIDRIAQVLQHRQFRFHEPRVVPVALVAHHAVFQLDVAHEIVIQLGAVWIGAHHPHGNPGKSARQHFLDVRAHQHALVLTHVEAVRSLGSRVALRVRAHDLLPWPRRIAVVIDHQGSPSRQHIPKGRFVVIIEADGTEDAETVAQFVNGRRDDVVLACQRNLAEMRLQREVGRPQTKDRMKTVRHVLGANRQPLELHLQQGLGIRAPIPLGRHAERIPLIVIRANVDDGRPQAALRLDQAGPIAHPLIDLRDQRRLTGPGPGRRLRRIVIRHERPVCRRRIEIPQLEHRPAGRVVDQMGVIRLGAGHAQHQGQQTDPQFHGHARHKTINR